SGVETLIPIPNESEGIPEHVCDVPSHDNSPPLDVSKDTIEVFSESNEEFSSTDDDSYSFDKIDYVEASPPILSSSAQSDDQSPSDEDVLEKIVSKPLCEKEIIPMKSLRTHDSSLPLSSEEFVFANSDVATESFSPSPIPIKDSDSLMEEMDLFCTLDYPMPPGIEDEDSDSERDILIPKDLPSNNSLSFAKKESIHFDIPPFS
nr:hypothetical protein [Tanacetum cinerariifolium]